MNYVRTINQILQPTIDKDLDVKVLDLFAGCGGLSLGFEASGFETVGYEMDEHACRTYNDNLIGDCHNVKLEIGFSYPNAQVIIGGPPCQPFSVGGKQKGLKDSRDGFPIFIDAVKSIDPETKCLRVLFFSAAQISIKQPVIFRSRWMFEVRYSLVFEE